MASHILTDLLFRFFHSNRKFAELYTEGLIGNTAEEIVKKKQTIFGAWAPLHDMRRRENHAKCVESFERKAFTGYEIFGVLKEMMIHNRPPRYYEADNFRPTLSEEIAALDELIKKLKKNGTREQLCALYYETTWEVYWSRRLVLLRELMFLKVDSDQVGQDAKSMLVAFYDQILPFGIKNHHDIGCVSAEDLPLFYKNRGDY